jgi:hypothetical protein
MTTGEDHETGYLANKMKPSKLARKVQLITKKTQSGNSKNVRETPVSSYAPSLEVSA